MRNIKEEIEILEAKLTGSMLADFEIKEAIHELKMEENGVRPSCGIDGGECENCGS